MAAGVGAGLGSLLRWSLTIHTDPGSFPWSTLAVNILGCALLALLPTPAWVSRHRLLTVLLGPGLLGGFTTMSAASVQTFVLLDGPHPWQGAAYAGATLLGALAAVIGVSRLRGEAG